MHKCLWLLVVGVLIGTAVAFGQAQPSLTPRQMMEVADRNDDGRIDRVEFLMQMSDAFYLVDPDKDGSITFAEYRQVMAGADAKRLQGADRNKDGKVSLDEFRKAIAQDFDVADRNDDGVLDLPEVEGFLRSR
jgi:Ca2+-binding EF-hand superfamily protein